MQIGLANKNHITIINLYVEWAIKEKNIWKIKQEMRNNYKKVDDLVEMKNGFLWYQQYFRKWYKEKEQKLRKYEGHV